MFMFICIVIVVILALLGVVVYLVSKMTRLKGELWAASQDAHRSRARAERAREKAAEAQADIQRLTAELSTEVANTGQALAIGTHIAYVSQQLGDLMAFIAPLAGHEPPGRHVMPPSMPAGEQLPGSYTRYLPYAHAGHNGVTPPVSDGVVHGIDGEGTGDHGA
jgi:hypothetical protein